MMFTLPLGQVGMIDMVSGQQLSASYLPYTLQGEVLSPDDHTAFVHLRGTDPTTNQIVDYATLVDYSSGTIQPTLPILSFDDPGNGDSNFIAADFNGDGSQVIVSYAAGRGSTATAWLEAFSVTTGVSRYRIPVIAGFSAMAIRH